MKWRRRKHGKCRKHRNTMYTMGTMYTMKVMMETMEGNGDNVKLWSTLQVLSVVVLNRAQRPAKYLPWNNEKRRPAA